MSAGLVVAWHGTAVLLALILAAVWLRVDPLRRARRIDVALSVLAAGGGAAAVWASVPADWIAAYALPLREGNTGVAVHHVFAQAGLIGPTLRVVTGLVAGLDPAPMVGLVRLNLTLHALTIPLFYGVAACVLKRRWTAALFAVAWAAHPSLALTALSETPTQLIALYTLLASPAVAVLADGARPGRAMAWVALAQLVVLGTALAGLRPELVVLAAVPVGTAAARTVLGDARVDRLAGRLAAGARAFWARPWWLRIGVLAAVAAPFVLLDPADFQARVALDMLDPVSPSNVRYPATLATELPLGLVALTVSGLVFAFARWRVFLLLPLAVLLLYKVYDSAGHHGAALFEMWRYVAMLAPAGMVMALFGWRGLEALAARLGAADPAWRRWAGALIAVGVVAWSPAPLSHAWLREPALLEDATEPPEALTRPPWTSLQREVRLLIRVVRDNPECVLATATHEVTPRTAATQAKPGEWLLVLAGGGLPEIVERPLRGRFELAAARETLLEGRYDPPCVVVYQGLDCHRLGTLGCRMPVRWRPPLVALGFGDRPYSEAHHGMRWPTLVLAAWRFERDEWRDPER